MTKADSADALIEQMQLQKHPEGGWYRETWRGPDNASGRAEGTAILFLLRADESSHWHTVDAHEMWFWQAGDPLELLIAESDAGPVTSTTLSADFGAGHRLQGHVPEGAWQAARPAAPKGIGAGYTLVSCVVVPGFEFEGFRLAEPGWEPGP